MKILWTYLPFQLLLGVVLGIFLPSFKSLDFIGIGFVLLFVFYGLLKMTNHKGFFNFLWILCLGIQIVQYSLYFHQSKLLKQQSLVAVGKAQIVTFTVEEELKENTFNYRYYGNVNAINNNEVGFKILIEQSKKEEALVLGHQYQMLDAFISLPLKASPYHFDYKAYLLRKGISYKLIIKETPVDLGLNLSLLLRIKQLRARLVHRIMISKLSPEAVTIIKTMILGDKTHIDKSIEQKFRDVGIVHLMAISGMHIGVLYLLLTQILGFLKRYSWGKYLYVIVILLLLWAFAVFSGLSNSIVRAVLMFSFIIITSLAINKRLTLESIILSMLILLIYQPNYLFEVGFQLSYSAVISIVVFYPLFVKSFKTKNKIKQYLRDILLISFIAQLGVLPLSLYYFHQFPIHFLVANFFAILLLPLVLYGAIIMLIVVYFNSFEFLMIAYNNLICFYLWMIDVLANLKFLVLENILISVVDIGVYLLLLIVLYLLFKKENLKIQYVLVVLVVGSQIWSVYQKYKNENTHFMVINTYPSKVIYIENHQGFVFRNDRLYTSILKPIKIKKRLLNVNYSEASIFKIKEKTYLIIDDVLPYHKLKASVDVLVITKILRLNWERTFKALQPKKIVIGKSFYKRDIEKIKGTCNELQIPFYDVNTQGAYME